MTIRYIAICESCRWTGNPQRLRREAAVEVKDHVVETAGLPDRHTTDIVMGERTAV